MLRHRRRGIPVSAVAAGENPVQSPGAGGNAPLDKRKVTVSRQVSRSVCQGWTQTFVCLHICIRRKSFTSRALPPPQPLYMSGARSRGKGRALRKTRTALVNLVKVSSVVRPWPGVVGGKRGVFMGDSHISGIVKVWKITIYIFFLADHGFLDLPRLLISASLL